MVFGGGLLAVALLALWVYCIFDVIATEESNARNLPKLVWLLVVVFLPTLGAVAWLLLGRPRDRRLRPGDDRYRAPRRERAAPPRRASRPIGPEDSPEFLAELQERLRRERGE